MMKMRRGRHWLLWLAVASAPACASCRGEGEIVGGVPSVTTPNGSKVALAIAPKVASVKVGGSLTFAAAVAGTSDMAVMWTGQEGSAGGGIDNDGVYTAPQNAGTHHVVATRHARPTHSR